jgi:outer membrane scaffolding protein for murein synthesis (MipA/OmpV family)
MRYGLLAILAALPSLAWAGDDAPSYAFGAGVQQMPSWDGAATTRRQAVPYVDIDVPGVGELSTTDGLTLDLIHGEHLHGGFYGNWLWGRTRDSLGSLGGKVTPLSPRWVGGGYLEYAFDKAFSVGTHLAHDTSGASAYAAVYADLQLPGVWYIQHSLEVQVEGMNGAGMNRFYGLSASEASALATRPFQPSAGWHAAHLEYDAFVPTSEHTGFAVAWQYGRLFDPALQSPLVRDFGSRRQVTTSLAFVVHY